MATRPSPPFAGLRIAQAALLTTIFLPACADDTSSTSADESSTGDEPTTSTTMPPTTTTASTTASSTDPSTTDLTTTTDPTDTTTDTTTTDPTDTTTTDPTETTTTDTDTTTGGDLCGNGTVDAGEECDGADLDGSDCENEGFDGGELACDSECAYDTSGCFTKTCGNNTVEGAEICDGTDLDGYDCQILGFDDGTLDCASGCAAFDSSGCYNYVCGNNVIEGSEFCDGSQLNGATCVSESFDAGVLGCLDDCSDYDTSNCQDAPACIETDLGSAVGAAVATGNTDLEDEDLGQSCAGGGAVDHILWWVAPADGFYLFDTFGSTYDTALALYSDCNDADEIACNDDAGGLQSQVGLAMSEGQGVVISVNGFAGETGDWILNIETGDLSGPCCDAHPGPGCLDDSCASAVCSLFPGCCTNWTQLCADTADTFCTICNTDDVCGNGVTEAGETCDGADVGGSDCVSEGFDAGLLLCEDDCSGLDTSNCANFEGDCCAAHAEPGCDDSDCVDTVCGIFPFCCDPGNGWDDFCAFIANDNCGACVVPDICGNNVIDGMPLETCDGIDVGGMDCTDFGFETGNLGCLGDCSDFDTSGCFDFAEDCCFSLGTPGCTDGTCEADICSVDSFCCDTAWDDLCAAEANGFCSLCGGGTGDCCNDTGAVGCDDLDCVFAVCGPGGDQDCCNVDWDASCVATANAVCAVCGP